MLEKSVVGKGWRRVLKRSVWNNMKDSNLLQFLGEKWLVTGALPEPHLWQIKSSTLHRSEPEEVIGYVAVYVDDLVVTGSKQCTQPIGPSLRLSKT